MKIFLPVTILAGCFFSSSASSEELVPHESNARALLANGVTTYTTKTDFDGAVAANLAAIPTWTVNFENVNPTPDSFIAGITYKDNAVVPVDRITLSASLGTNNNIQAIVGVGKIAVCDVDGVSGVSIDPINDLYAWGARFESITQNLVFEVSYGGTPSTMTDAFVVNTGTSFVGFVSTIFPITNIVIFRQTGGTTTFRMDDIQGALQPAPSSTPSRAPSRTPSKSPSRKPSAKPSSRPSRKPSQSPSRKPSARPSRKPSAKPSTSNKPSSKPSSRPSRKPSSRPSRTPSRKPSAKPSKMPTAANQCPFSILIIPWLLCIFFGIRF